MASVTEQTIETAGGTTFVRRSGTSKSEAVLFIHGSGPGANGWANWQFALPALGERFDCIAPDLVGFGKSAHPYPPPQGARAWLELWLHQLLSLLDELGVRSAHVVGNSLGGAIALHLLARAPEKFRKAVLMGPIGVRFPIPHQLDRVWGFYEEPTLERLTTIFSWFVYDPARVGGDLEAIARQRFDAALAPPVARSFAAMFPAPRQRHVDDLAVAEETLSRIDHPVLLMHGRDDVVVPLETSLTLLRRLPRAQLHVFGRCSHWIQIEHRDAFNEQVAWFLTRPS